MSDDELESFKRLNLVDFAVSRGYKQDDVESSVNSAVLRQGDDKVIVKRNDNGHWVYFSVRDDADHGSIVDFVKHREGLTLGKLRIAIRQYMGTYKPSLSYCPPSKPPTQPPLKARMEAATRRLLRSGMQRSGTLNPPICLLVG